MSWRDILKIHPAAEIFPLMSPDELKALGEDIKRNGLKHDVVALGGKLIDGRNRLDSMEAVGLVLKFEERDKRRYPDDLVFMARIRDADNNIVGWCKHETKAHVPDPYAYIISANIHRRHLTGEQKRGLIEKLLKATPERSDRATAAIAKVSDKTVAAVRDRLEQGAEIPHQRDRVGKDGVTQPATKAPTPKSPDRKYTLAEFIRLFPKRVKVPVRLAEQVALNTVKYSAEEALAKLEALAPSFSKERAAPVPAEPFYADPGAGFDIAPEARPEALMGRSGCFATIKGNWPFLTTEEKAEFLDWVHDNELALYHGACKRSHEAAERRIEAEKDAPVTGVAPDTAVSDEIVAAMRADHAAGMPIAKIARKHGFRYINQVKEALGLPA